mmetsp:Transcript_46741/g.75802  ORF Transcript_46741/g.75802 Transcript_46741/m.75802 type:complete len:95 (-) Transcript_46741:8-292(-)
MGNSLDRTIQSCWDPEGVAEIVRKKKQQRAAINKYDELLKRAEASDPDAVAEIRQYDGVNKAKGVGEFKGKFWDELLLHHDWSPLAARRTALGM